jgi:hypothetical protein
MKSNNRLGMSCCGGCGAIIIAFVLILAIRWGNGIKPPNLTVPAKPQAPSPNAFDTYRGAAQLLVNTKQIGDALGSKPAVVLSLPQKEALLNSNGAALRMLRGAFSQEYYDPSVRSIYTLYPYYAQFRAMARLFAFEGSVRAQKADWNGAVQSDLDCMRLGATIPRGGPLIGELVGIACQAIGRRNLWDYIGHLDARQARLASKLMQDIDKLYVPYPDTLQEERYMQMSALNALFKDKNGMQAVFGPQTGPPVALYQLMYLVYSKETIASNNQKYFDQLIANSRQPYALHVGAPPAPSDPINKILAPEFSQARIKDVEARTQNGLLRLAMALHAYKLERGHYPESLAALTPSYVSTIPDDPFAARGPFQYHIIGSKYVLYSVGPDGKDDGGKPIDDASKATSSNKNARYLVDADSKGDIVAGKNIW